MRASPRVWWIAERTRCKAIPRSFPLLARTLARLRPLHGHCLAVVRIYRLLLALGYFIHAINTDRYIRAPPCSIAEPRALMRSHFPRRIYRIITRAAFLEHTNSRFEWKKKKRKREEGTTVFGYSFSLAFSRPLWNRGIILFHGSCE